MSKEAIQKEIDRLRDEKNHLWNALIVSVGGSLALLFNLDNPFKLIFSIVGFLVGFIFLNGYFKKDDKIDELIEKLKEEAL